ncbi:uncharacterized protein LOC106157407 [Lingula anatina]|uniref:Uncharacterized protein LOC106157407 n=1 Tax=Lingula anatina TaxID=7574 RepID=A0A2R2MJC2_LINAN|nr:uncharacterized protein LOC106157407 [Lingula anatina]|eukprot:XP_023930308.1 uncharacterized protein LOC106157407 [Lingula anatina]
MSTGAEEPSSTVPDLGAELATSARSRSVSSTGTSSTIRKRAKAEAARARLKFAEQEVELKKQQAILEEQNVIRAAERNRQKAELEAELELLMERKSHAAAEAEAQVLEDEEIQLFPHRRRPESPGLPIESAVNRTAAFVERHSAATIHTQQSDTRQEQSVSAVTAPQFLEIARRPEPVPSAVTSTEVPQLPRVLPEQLNPNASEFTPATENGREMTGIMNYLLKKELLLTRLTTFQETPETYASWKESFVSMKKDLALSASEEVDLLIRWLGPTSRKHAISIKTANPSQPQKAVKEIWERLEERYGSPELIESVLRKKIDMFPKLTSKDTLKLYELLDLLSEIQAFKEDELCGLTLSYLDSAVGINPIVAKLTQDQQNKWTSHAVKYKENNRVHYPPFPEFVKFIKKLSQTKNNPCFQYDFTHNTSIKDRPKERNMITSRKTDVAQKEECPLHGTNHELRECRVFGQKSPNEQKCIMRKYGYCFGCCRKGHIQSSCGEKTFPSQTNFPVKGAPSGIPERRNNAERRNNVSTDEGVAPRANGGEVITKCTALCEEGFVGRSCAKNVLVRVFPKGRPEEAVAVYAVHDDQSNKSLGTPALFDQLQISGGLRSYSLSSCSGTTHISARHAVDLIVESYDGTQSFVLPEIIECDIPKNRSEIPTPEVAMQYDHLSSLSEKIPPLNPKAEIGLLIGRDLIEAHHVQDQLLGSKNHPFGQKLPLGWVIIGEVCLGKVHQPKRISAFKTNIMNDGRPTNFLPCPSAILLKEENQIGSDVFKITAQDDRVSLSTEDREFLDIMNESMRNDKDQWMAPLPFKHPRQRMPNNRSQVFGRAKSFDAALKKDERKLQHMVEFMENIFDTQAAEVAPELPPGKEVWYLPLFAIYHPRKPDKVRGVFDSSVKYEGYSLNENLLTGPNQTNSLLGVLLRFRKDRIAVTADIQQMFYSFLVNEEHRDFLRFFWYRDNDPKKEIIEYRMRVHVFGNTPSPAVATYGLRKAVEHADEDVKHFVTKNFYVDDALITGSDSESLTDLVKRTQKVLWENGRIRLHKIASNSPDVVNAFPTEDREKTLMNLDLFTEELPTQASLGISWNMDKDCFGFSLFIPERPFTKRGILSTINSIFDPLGFLSPVTVTGKMLAREMHVEAVGWDDPLPEHLCHQWESWKSSLFSLREFRVPRMITAVDFSLADSLEVWIFSDASERAISAVAYLKARSDTSTEVGFIMGKSKLSPPGGVTIPRLELCAAVLATELADTISEHLDLPMETFKYCTDSRVVLGYLYNRTRRFYTYVSNRVATILKRSKASQWQYIPSEKNPADCGTRCNTPVQDFSSSKWITGPDFLKDVVTATVGENCNFDLVDEDADCEIRPTINVKATVLLRSIAARFEKFSTWKSLVRAISLLKRFCRAWKEKKQMSPKDPSDTEATEMFLIKKAQEDAFKEEISMVEKKAGVPADSKLTTLSPVLDDQHILRVGGRLSNAPLEKGQKHPIIIPKKSHIANLLVNHYHSISHHQGRHVTESALRSKGFWIIGAKRLISSILYKCVICRKLRGKFLNQRMADLPEDRVTPGPPFTSVGIDVFGPWPVVTRRTRGGQAESKRWALIFGCLVTRAVHIEVIEEMSSSSFINALRRFVAIRGPVKMIRSDRGTNFIGALDQIKATGIFVENGPVQESLHDMGIVWKFNPPHASHMGGAWERLIGLARRILDAMFLTSHTQKLTHEVLVTFMCEVSAVINSRPVAPISYDPEDPEIITPAMLLTQKKEPLPTPTTSTDMREIYQSQWKYVQILSNTFWKRWRDGYLQSLQKRGKWTASQKDLKIGDIVLLRDCELHRGSWPIGVVENVFPSGCDSKVRTVEVRTVKDGKSVKYVRPICELILLIDSW